MAELRVFGGPRLSGDDGRALGGPQEQALLALLAASSDRPISADRLIDALWRDAIPPTALKTVQVYVSRLRRVLGPNAIDRTPVGYVLSSDAVQLDAARFEALVAEGVAELGADDSEHAEAAFGAALAIANGAPYAGVADIDALAPEIHRLEELRWQALEGRFEAGLRNGRHEELISEIQRQLDDEPHRERQWGQLMLALYRSGRQADALAAYHRAREALDEELGLEPGPELQELERRILLQDEGLRAPDRRRPSNLPRPVSSLIGCEDELRELARLLAAERIVTIQGPGGVGKTRLAVEAANAVAGTFADGAFFVGLADQTDAELIPAEILGILGVRATSAGEPIEVLATYLASRRMLLVLDNLEQIAGAAGPIARLLERAPATHVLATSRGPLGIRGERTFVVEPLSSGRPEGSAPSAAARLFLERAAEFRPIHPGVAELAAIETICERLDGLPLAIELVARLTRFMDTTEILDEVVRGRLAMEWHADVPERQRTLRGTIRWSQALLPEPAQRAFPLLGLFANEFARPAFDALVAAVLPGSSTTAIIAALADQSLVRRAASRGGPARFALLDTVRLAASELLAESPDVQAAAHGVYVAHYLALAEASESALNSRDQVPVGEQLDADLDNVRAALRAGIDAQLTEPVLRAAAALRPYWERRGRLTEGRRWLDAALQLAPGAPPALVGKVRNAAGTIAMIAGDFPAARVHLEAALELRQAAGDPTGAMMTLGNLGILAWELHDFDRATAIYRECLSAATELGDEWGVGAYEGNLGNVALEQGEFDVADARFAAATTQFERLGDTRSIAMLLSLRARGLFAVGKLDEAVPLVERAAALADEADSWITRVAARRQLARIAARQGHPSRALTHLRIAFDLAVAADDQVEIADVLEVAAQALVESDPGTTARALGAAARIREDFGKPRWPLDAQGVEDAGAYARGSLGAADFQRAFDEGAAADVLMLVERVKALSRDPSDP